MYRRIVVTLTLSAAALLAGTAPAAAEHVRGSDHYTGKARDVMVSGVAAGNRVAACALGKRGVTYVIWRQRINYGSGWQHMEDRGGATANHMDHVHVSFVSRAAQRAFRC